MDKIIDNNSKRHDNYQRSKKYKNEVWTPNPKGGGLNTMGETMCRLYCIINSKQKGKILYNLNG